jgi:uncharacterized protein YegL
LPVYLLLDTSGSMTGEPIEAVRQGVKALVSDLRGDPMALENAFLSVITFSSAAQQVCPLTELVSFQEPPLNAGGTTALGEALKLLDQCIDKEVRKASASQKGDWKPLIFLMTDGEPTDNWEPAADVIKAKRPGNLIACAAGPNANPNVLKRVTESVVELKSLQPDQLKAFFKWVSSSIKTASQKIDAAPAATADAAAVNLAPPPASSGINIVL